MATNQENLTQTMRFTLPSGYYVVIREMNGEDDDILSNKFDQQNLEHHTNFLSTIIVDTNLPMNQNGKITKEAALEILLNDKYAILFYCRIFSIDPIIKFPYNWLESENKTVKIDYEDDLRDYVWDFSKPYPKEGEKEYNPYMVKPYAEKPYEKITYKLASGKEVKMGLLNTKSERVLAKSIIEQTYSRPKDLISRELEVKVDGQWMLVENFAMFSKKDMTELYKLTELIDPTFLGISELLNEKTGEIIKINLITLTDFFFPEEI